MKLIYYLCFANYSFNITLIRSATCKLYILSRSTISMAVGINFLKNCISWSQLFTILLPMDESVWKMWFLKNLKTNTYISKNALKTLEILTIWSFRSAFCWFSIGFYSVWWSLWSAMFGGHRNRPDDAFAWVQKTFKNLDDMMNSASWSGSRKATFFKIHCLL